MGIEGCDRDVRSGPAFLPSGPQEAYDAVKPLLDKAAAEVDHHACVGYIGDGALGALAKMVVHGLVTGEAQLLAEAYDLMRQARMSNSEMSDIFTEWNQSELASALLAASAVVAGKKDCDVAGCKPSDAFLVERIFDQPPKLESSDATVEAAAGGAASGLLGVASAERYVAEQRGARSQSGREARRRAQ